MPIFEWETPQDFFDTLNDEFHFDIDLCATKQNTKCSVFYTYYENSLCQEWKKTCWLNPPYDKDIGRWVSKAYESAQEGATVVCLVQGRSTDTRWFHNFAMKSSEIRFIKDRLHFGLNKNFRRANISSMVIVFRPHCKGPPIVSSIDNKGRSLISKS